MSRVYNFSAGPAVLPEEVLKEAADEMLDYQGSGMSVMEMSHRSKVYDNIIKEAEQDLRDLLNIPDNYKVLFLQGGASQFFAEVPMNLMKNRKAGYILTGQWAKKAFQEAKIYGEAVELASSADETFSYIPDCSDLPITDDMDYVYICENNTIYGTKYKKLPNTKGRILVSDVSSCFLSEPMDVTNYGVVYGGVQKNIGPAGYEYSRNIDSCCCHQKSRNVFITVWNHDKCIELMCECHTLGGICDQISCDKRIFHPDMSHCNSIAHCDRREYNRHTACLCNA